MLQFGKRSVFAWVLVPILLIFNMPAAYSRLLPKFQDFEVKSIYGGKRAPLQLSDPKVSAYRTRLQASAQEAVNFGGHFRVEVWGCGTKCATGAIVDVVSGRISLLPFTVCCWGDVNPKFRPIEFKPNSTLMIFRGQINEQGQMGAHFYAYRDGQFQNMTSVATDDKFAQPGNDQTNASQEAHTDFIKVKLCNGASQPVNIMLVYSSQREPDKQMMSGWFAVSPRQCKNMPPVSRKPIFAFAQGMNGSRWPRKGPGFCVSPRQTEHTVFPGQPCIRGEAFVGFSPLRVDGSEAVWRIR